MEVDLTFSSDDCPVEMDIIDLVHIIYIVDDWKCALFGNVIYHRVAQTACSGFFLSMLGTNKTRTIQKQLSRTIWNLATPSCCRSETNWSSVGRFNVMQWSKRKSLLLFDLPVLVSQAFLCHPLIKNAAKC